MRRIKTIDAEVAGEVVRLVVEGGPSVQGRTMAEKLNWLKRHGDEMRRLLMLEPRGHAGMHGALLTEAVSPGAHAGLLSMHAAGFPLISGEGVMAAVTIALENGILQGPSEELLFDTPAGTVRARPRYAPGASAAPRISSVAVVLLPSFVRSGGLSVQVGKRTFSVDVAFGGEFYAIADSEAIGIPIEMSNGDALIRMGREIQEALGTQIHGTIFTGAPRAATDLRSATVLDGAVLRRSPGVTGTAALVAVLEAMGLLAADSGDHRFIHEGILGTRLEARVLTRQVSEDVPNVVPMIEGSASTTGYHEFVSG